MSVEPKAATRERPVESAWSRPALLNGMADALYGLAAVAILAVAVLMLSRLPVFAVDDVAVSGALKHVTRSDIESAARRAVRGNFFTVDLDAARHAFEALTWVRSARVRRHWPSRLEVALEEHEPLARWSQVMFVNTHGELFRAVYGGELPVFSGPEGGAREMAIQYRYFRRALAAIGETPVHVQVTLRRAWQVRLASGMTLSLGRENIEARLSRFVEAYPRTVAPLARRVDYVDLRYANGFAVRVPGLRDEAPQPARARGKS
jgi:cell division protein FtsQ